MPSLNYWDNTLLFRFTEKSTSQEMKNLLIALALIAVFAAVQAMPAGKWMALSNKDKTQIWGLGGSPHSKYRGKSRIISPTIIFVQRVFWRGYFRSGRGVGLLLRDILRFKNGWASIWKGFCVWKCYNDRVDVRAARAKMSMRRAKNIFAPKNINSITIIIISEGID